MSNSHSHSSLPNKKVFVVGALCVTVLLVSFSYKLNEEKKLLLTRQGGGQVVAGETESISQNDARIEAALQKTQIESMSTIENPFAPKPTDNTSDTFAKNIFSAYLKYDQDASVNTDDLAGGVINGIKTNDLPKDKYTLGDIRVYAPQNKEQIRLYANEFGKIYIDAITPVNTDPTKYNTSVKNLAIVYRNLYLKLLTIQVPNTLSVPHIQIINTFYILSESLPIIEDQSKDPVRSLLALRLVQDSMLKQVELFKTIDNYFKQNDILFTKDEPGYIWGVTTGQN